MKACGLVLIIFTLTFVSPATGAELRQWTDENGVRHFSNKKERPGDISADKTWEEKESSPYTSPPVYRQPPVEAGPVTGTRPSSGNGVRGDILQEIRSKEALQREMFDRIYAKRRYVKRQGKKDIERMQRLTREIEDLEKSGAASGKIDRLRAEKAAAMARLFKENLRTRKGVGDDLKAYKKLEDEIKKLREDL